MKLCYGIFLICLFSTFPIVAQSGNDFIPVVPQNTESSSDFIPVIPKEPASLPTKVDPQTTSNEANGIDVKKLQELPVMNEEKSNQISQYFEEALKNYEDILNQERSSEVKTSERRIENNIELLKRHRQSLNTSESDLRKMRVEYMERYLLLKNSYEKGRIDKKTYQQQLEKLAQDYRFRMNSALSDRDFYKNEAQKTQERLKELEEFNRINKIVLAQEGALMPKEQQPLNEFEKIISDIQQLGCFEVKNFCASPEFK